MGAAWDSGKKRHIFYFTNEGVKVGQAVSVGNGVREGVHVRVTDGVVVTVGVSVGVRVGVTDGVWLTVQVGQGVSVGKPVWLGEGVMVWDKEAVESRVGVSEGEIMLVNEGTIVWVADGKRVAVREGAAGKSGRLPFPDRPYPKLTTTITTSKNARPKDLRLA